MVKTNHSSAVTARRELLDSGYRMAFSPPGAPEKWQQSNRKGICLNGSTYTVARLDHENSTVWEILEYPQ